MTIQALLSSRDIKQPLRHVCSAPVRLQTYRNLLYLVLMVPLGIAYFVSLTIGFSVGIGLSIILIGIPIIVLTLALSVGLAALERTLARSLLRADIPLSSLDTEQTSWGRLKQIVTDRWTWRAVVYLLSKFIAGIVIFHLLISLLATSVRLLLAPLYYKQMPVSIHFGHFRHPPVIEFTPTVMFGWDNLLVGLTTTVQIEIGQVTTLPAALLVAGVGAVLFLLSLQLSNSLAWVWGRYTRRML